MNTLVPYLLVNISLFKKLKMNATYREKLYYLDWQASQLSSQILSVGQSIYSIFLTGQRL